MLQRHYRRAERRAKRSSCFATFQVSITFVASIVSLSSDLYALGHGASQNERQASQMFGKVKGGLLLELQPSQDECVYSNTDLYLRRQDVLRRH